jgi:uncharacterized protein YbjT (DUF2867 family)
LATTGKVLVTGATGNTGPGLVSALCKAGVDVRVLVRDAAKARPLQAMGAEVVVGDLDRPETLEPAIAGVAKVYLLTWNGPTQAQQVHDFIHAAKRVGAPHIVRHSMWGSPRSRIIEQGDQAEAEIGSSGLPWTMLKPTFFMQNTMMAARTIANDGVSYWDMKDGRLGMIDVRDIIDVAVAVLTGDGHEGQSYVLTGPAAISFHDVAATFSAVLGTEITYVPVPGEAALKSMTGMGFPEWVSRGFIELSEGFSEGFASQITGNVAALTGHPARSFEQYARDFADIFRSAAVA